MATQLKKLESKLQEVEEAVRSLGQAGRARTGVMDNLLAEQSSLKAAIAAERSRPTRSTALEDGGHAAAVKVYEEASPYLRGVMLTPPAKPSWTSLGARAGRTVATVATVGALGLAAGGLRSLATLPQHRQALGVVCFHDKQSLKRLCKSAMSLHGWREEWFTDRPFLAGVYRIDCDRETIRQGDTDTSVEQAIAARKAPALVVIERSNHGKKEVLLADPQSRSITFEWLIVQ